MDLAELVDDSKIDWDKWVSFEENLLQMKLRKK
ncbi:hypothetical protein OBG91_14275 [Lactococcus lactis]|nr:hypothetical protein [Lactococcus lactis]